MLKTQVDIELHRAPNSQVVCVCFPLPNSSLLFCPSWSFRGLPRLIFEHCYALLKFRFSGCGLESAFPSFHSFMSGEPLSGGFFGQGPVLTACGLWAFGDRQGRRLWFDRSLTWCEHTLSCRSGRDVIFNLGISPGEQLASLGCIWQQHSSGGLTPKECPDRVASDEPVCEVCWGHFEQSCERPRFLEPRRDKTPRHSRSWELTAGRRVQCDWQWNYQRQDQGLPVQRHCKSFTGGYSTSILAWEIVHMLRWLDWRWCRLQKVSSGHIQKWNDREVFPMSSKQPGSKWFSFHQRLPMFLRSFVQQKWAVAVRAMARLQSLSPQPAAGLPMFPSQKTLQCDARWV